MVTESKLQQKLVAGEEKCCYDLDLMMFIEKMDIGMEHILSDQRLIVYFVGSWKMRILGELQMKIYPTSLCVLMFFAHLELFFYHALITY